MNLYKFHGYNHEPGNEKHGPARPGGHFDQWEQGVFAGRETVRVPWDSGLMWKDTFRAWLQGCLNSYHLAYNKLSLEAALTFVAEGPPTMAGDAFGHSLGTKVIIDILEAQPAKFRRVLLCNGAVLVKHALPVIEMNPHVQFLNIACRADDTLDKMGARFADGNPFRKARCIGNGLELDELPPNLDQVILDDYDTQVIFAANGYDNIRGDDPNNYGDHSYSFEHEGNWPIFRYFLDTGRLPA